MRYKRIECPLQASTFPRSLQLPYSLTSRFTNRRQPFEYLQRFYHTDRRLQQTECTTQLSNKPLSPSPSSSQWPRAPTCTSQILHPRNALYKLNLSRPAKARNFPSASGTVSAPYADESYSAQYSSNPETTTSSLSRIYDAITDAMATISDLLPQLSPSEREDNYDLPSQNEDN